jgi:DNA-3-methyladenine glycosylase I
MPKTDQQEPAHRPRGGESLNRCSWAAGDALLEAYHDREWGVPLHDDQRLFELLTLEGAQAGLSWLTVLRRRDGYREAFAGFDIPTVAAFGQAEIERLLETASIIRNRQKVISTVENARGVLEIQREHGSFDRFLWSFVPNATPIVRKSASIHELPTVSPESESLSKALRKRRFRFVGPTICYAFMEAAGLVNDHLVTCFRYSELT